MNEALHTSLGPTSLGSIAASPEAAAAPLRTEEYVINMGPQHPSTHGVMRLLVRLDGETVLEVTPHLGYIHRGIEKMCENLNCDQILPLTDRMDYLSAHMNNWCWCALVEQALGIEVPERAEVVRVLLSELQRIQSHQLWWGVFGMDLGAFTPFLYGFRDRELITDIFEETCGARLTMHYLRIGGLAWDVHENFVPRIKAFLEYFPRVLDEYDGLLSSNPIIVSRSKGVGGISATLAQRYGCSGAVLRACGIPYDLRKTSPYGIYDRFDFEVPIGTNGDCYDRYMVRMKEMRQSLRIIEQALPMLEPGPFAARRPRLIELPAGDHYYSVEAARGHFGCYVHSQGEENPWRVKFRSPSYSNLSAINEMAPGFKLADLVTIISTLDLIIPDIDR